MWDFHPYLFGPVTVERRPPVLLTGVHGQILAMKLAGLECIVSVVIINMVNAFIRDIRLRIKLA